MRSQQIIEAIEAANLKTQQIADRAHFATESIAYNLSRSYAANPFLNRKILTTLAINGMNEQQINQVANIATRRMLADGVMPDTAAPAAPRFIAPRVTPSQPSYADQTKQTGQFGPSSAQSSLSETVRLRLGADDETAGEQEGTGTRYWDYNDGNMETKVHKFPIIVSPEFRPIELTTGFDTTGTSATTVPGISASGLQAIATAKKVASTAREIANYGDAKTAGIPFFGDIYSGARLATGKTYDAAFFLGRSGVRNAQIGIESVWEFGSNVASQYVQHRVNENSTTVEDRLMRDSTDKREAFASIWSDAKQLGQAAEATQLGQLFRQQMSEGRMDTGSGWFAGPDLRARQAEAQQNLLGTLTDPEGTEVIYTLGRGLVSDAEGQALTDNMLLYSLISGTIDGAAILAFDPTKKIPFIGWGKRYSQGLPTPRAEAKYYGFQKAARYLSDEDPIANAETIEYLMMQALRALHITPESKIGRGGIIRQANNLSETEIAQRAVLIDQLGMLGTRENPTFLAPNFAKWLSGADGSRTIDFLVKTTEPRQIMQWSKGKYGSSLQVDLARAKTPDEVIDIMGRALANPGKDMQNQLRLFPSMGVFRVAEHGMWIKRNINSHVRSGQYLPVGVKMMFNDPTMFLRQFDTLFRSFPVARHAAKLSGQRSSAYDQNFLDAAYKEMAEAFHSGTMGDVYNVVEKAETLFNDMFKGLGYTIDQSNALTAMRQDMGRLNSFMAADLVSNVPEKIIRSPLVINQMLADGVFIVDPQQLERHLRQASLVREWARRHTRWGRASATRYDLLEKLADKKDELGIASDALDQMITSGAALPDQILINEERVQKLFGEVNGITSDLSKIDAKIDVLDRKNLTGMDARLWDRAELFAESGRYVWKSSTIARIAYVTRVVPEEVARVLASGAFDGPMDYLLSITPEIFGGFAGTGRYGLDAAGDVIATSARKSMQLEIDFDKVNDLVETIEESLTVLNLPPGMSVAEFLLSGLSTQKLLDPKSMESLRKLVEKRNLLNQQLDQSYLELEKASQGLRRAQIGADRAKTLGVVFRERIAVLAATGHFKIADRAQPAQIGFWADGLADKLGFYASTGEMPLAATLMNPLAQLQLKDLTTIINGVDATIVEHFSAGRIQHVEDWLAHYYHSGSGREIWEEWYKSTAARKDTSVIGRVPGDTVKDALEWVIKQTEELSYLSAGENGTRGQQLSLYQVLANDGNFYDIVPSLNGMNANPQILEMIETGSFQGRPIFGLTDPGKNRTGYSLQVKEKLHDFLLDFGKNSSNAPQRLHYDTMTIHGERTMRGYERIVGTFFKSFYGVPSDILSRNPLFKRTYWNQVAEMIDMVDSKTAKSILKEAKNAGVSQKLLEKIRIRGGANLGGDDGASFEIVDQMARIGAIEYVADLLYDANKRGSLADALRFIIPFGDAYKEVYATWAKLLYGSGGKPAIRLAQTIEAGKKATAIGPGDIYGIDPDTNEPTARLDGVPEGFFFPDPVSGELMFELPMSGELLRLGQRMSGVRPVPGVKFDVPLKNVNIAGELRPGLMPGTKQAVNFLMPDDPAWNGINEFFNPYGNREFDLFPDWLKRGVSIFAGNEFTREFANVIANSEQDPVFQRMRNQIIRQLQSAKNYDEEGVLITNYGADNQAELIREANKLALRLQTARGIANFIGPGAPVIRYSAETDDGNLYVSLMISEIRREKSALIAEGQDPDLAVINFLEDYGVNMAAYTSGINKSVRPGVDSSKEFREWYQVNKEFFDRFPNVGGYFGPTGKYDQTAASALQKAKLYVPMSPEEKMEQLATQMIFLRLNLVRDTLPPESERTIEQRNFWSETRQNLERFWGVSVAGQGVDVRTKNDQQMREMERLMVKWVDENDQSLAPIMDTATGNAIIDYMAYRAFYSEKAVAEQRLSTDGWKTANKASSYRDALRGIGEDLAKRDSGFSRLWFTVLSRELRDQEDPVDYENLREVSGPRLVQIPEYQQ